MAAGNKKKKKTANNPARGFATTSVQSKSNIEKAKDSDASAVTTPATEPIPESKDTPAPHTVGADQDVSDLSPEELEARLETFELQTLVDTHAPKVKKDAARHALRLQTDRRILRGQAEPLSLKQWLPEELMLRMLDLITDDLEYEHQNEKSLNPSSGDDLLLKVWTLRLTLLELDISLARANEAIADLLQHPPNEDANSLVWGLSRALDWLALNGSPGELLDYDDVKKKSPLHVEDSNDDSLDSEGQNDIATKKHDSPIAGVPGSSATSEQDDDLEVSDVESDLEPDELVTVHVRTKAALYGIDPTFDDHPAKGRSSKVGQKSTTNGNSGSRAEQKLRRKLQSIEADVLFDQREADVQWMSRRIELAQEMAQRKRLGLHNQSNNNSSSVAGLQLPSHDEDANTSRTNGDGDEQSLNGVDEGDEPDMLSGMFDSLPGVADSRSGGQDGGNDSTVIIRNFGRVAGITPRRVLEESCRSRDSRCQLTYRQVSATVYACRHSLVLSWSREQDFIEGSYIKSIAVKSKPRQLSVTMTGEATTDSAQSESYVATAALFLLFSGSPKDEKSHLRLPPAFRDLWDEFSKLKQEQVDETDRNTVKEIRQIIEQHPVTDESDHDDEVVFNASMRRINGSSNGTGSSTPLSRPQTPRLGESEQLQELQGIWTRKISTPSYQRMLASRANLPMFHYQSVVLETIEKNQVTIIVSDTGSGKSTQVPQFLLGHELSQGRQCKIYCTQPRRISAISLAQRVSEELGEQRRDLGTVRSLVGYAIRLESQTVAQTKLIYATVGIVLRMIEGRDGLSDVSHLIIDEVHERSIDTDFLLIVLRSLLVRRPDLKVVLMSATVDAQKFSTYLDGAPVIAVPGRTFPVQALFLEDAINITGYTEDDAHVAKEKNEEDEDRDIDSGTVSKGTPYLKDYPSAVRNVLATYDEYKINYNLIVKLIEVVAYNAHYQQFSQAILLFVPGIQEIKQLHNMLSGHPSFLQGWRIYPLHSAFSSDDQQSAFDVPPPGIRKIVIATNIAETGITIPDVTCVIDTGKHREMRFDERRQMSRLTQSWIAKANAKQRRGRAGRVQEGICFHLFTRSRYEDLMPEQQTPEMLRLSLQDLVMRVKICNLGGIEDTLSQALDPPSSKNVRRAIDALIEVGALTEKEQLTSLGSQLAKLPLDAQLGKLILYGALFGCLDSALTAAATLTSKSPFLSPLHAKAQADSVRLGFKRGDSDLLTVFNAYKAWRTACTTPGLSERNFCNKNFLIPQNLANIEDLKRQLFSALVEAGFVSLDIKMRAALNTRKSASHSHHQRDFLQIPPANIRAESNDALINAVTAWSFYPRLLRRDGKGWRNIANNQSLALHPTSVNKHGLPAETRFLSFYNILSTSTRSTNAQETSAVSDFALVLLAGDARWDLYAGVVVLDGHRLKFAFRDWRSMVAVKFLRAKAREILSRGLKYPGKEVGVRLARWVEVFESLFEARAGARS